MTATTTASLKDRRRRAAQFLEVEETAIQTVEIQYDKLRQLGLLIDIDVRGLSMFQASASWADFGIHDEDEKEHDRFRLGAKLLLPKAVFNGLRSEETMARSDLRSLSFDVPGFRPWRWLPLTAYNVFKVRLNDRIARWNKIKRDIIANRDVYLDLLSKDFAKIAANAWLDLERNNYEAIKVNGRIFTRKSNFVDYVVEQAQRRFPTEQKINADLVISYQIGIVGDGFAGGADFTRAEQSEGEYAAKFAAIRQAEYDAARARLAEMGSPFDAVANELRARVLEQVKAIYESVQKNGFLKGKVAAQASGLLEFYDMVSVMDQGELRQLLSQLKNEIGPVGESRKQTYDEAAIKRDNTRIATLLLDIVRLADKAVRNVTLDSRFANLDI